MYDDADEITWDQAMIVNKGEMLFCLEETVQKYYSYLFVWR